MMTAQLRFDSAHPTGERRWTMGILVSSTCKRASAALVAASGRGAGARVEIVGVTSIPIPAETTALFAQLSDTRCLSASSGSVGSIVALRAELAEIEAALASDLLARTGVADARVLVLGVHDPGLWTWGKTSAVGYLGLCDAGRVAEMTGMNVIDAFPARDVAQGGQGGPITALAERILLSDANRGRVLLDLGRTARLSYLPADSVDNAAGRVLSFDVGPGTSLLDLLTRRLTGGEHGYDPGGRFAVQGRRIPDLIEHWLADPYFERPLPRWHPRGVGPQRFLADALQMAVDSGWSVRDLLCTATHFVAEAIATAVDRRLPEGTVIDEIVLTGGGVQNGMLLREIATRLRDVRQVKIGELGVSSEALGPAAVALLALFHLDQVPANLAPVTGAEIPRILGRLTPGSPQSWQRLLHHLLGSTPQIRPLRSAL